MKVIVDGQLISESFDTLQTLDQYWKDFTRQLGKKNAVIEYIEIDQKRVYTDFEKTIVDQFHNINQLDIHTVSEIELLNETAQQLKAYNQKMIAEAESVSDPFYGEMNDRHWRSFAEFSHGMEWLYNASHSVVFLMEKHHLQPEIRDELRKICTQLEGIVRLLDEAFQSEDHTAIGDVIRFELVPVLEKMELKLPDQIGAVS